MAETDKIIELGREPGFVRSVFNAVYTLLVLKYYTWRFYWDVSWILYHRKSQNCSKIVLNCSKFQIGVYFGLWGWAGFLSVDWLIACSDSENGSTSVYYIIHTSPSHHHQFTDHIILCECQQSLPDWESCVSSLVCACHGSVIVPACQMSRSVPVCQRVIQMSIQMFIQMSWKPRRWATVPDGSSSSS